MTKIQCDCGEEKVVWFTDNVFWNSVMRNFDGLESTTLNGIACIPCFIKHAEKKYKVQAWRLIPEFKKETKKST